jgi:putative CocE/NonD family hydrolase
VSASVSDSWIEAADGLSLRCRLWKPAGPGPWPVLLMRQPYGRAIASTITYAHPQWYASQGYAVVVQDVRGRGDSQGHFLGFRQEPADGSSTLAWLRSQPWCNGRIGSYGFSYQGLSQLLLSDASQLPDALVPAMAGLDERLHWASEGGCHWWALGLGWGLQLAAQAAQRRGDAQTWAAIRASLESNRFLTDGLALLERHDPNGMAAEWFRLDPATAQGWRVHQPSADLWQRPMLLIGGWHDPHLKGVLDLWQRSHAAGANPLLRVGAWTHLHWRGGIDRLQLAFFDRHLRNRDGAAPLPAEPCWLEDLRSNNWLPRSPQQASQQRWGLSSAGLAAVDSHEGRLQLESAGCGSVTVVHDPWRPLPGRGGHLGLDAGCVERGDLDQRCDVACFSSRPCEQTMELIGQPLLQLSAAADQPGFDLCVALSVVKPDGTVIQCSTGVARQLGSHCLQQASREVRLQPLLLTLQAGEQLRLSIGLAAWPQIAVNPGDGSLPQGPASAQHRVISVTLQLDQASLSIEPMLGAN